MCRSFSRLSIAAFILALVLFTVPAQALPGDSDSSLPTVDASWLDMALSWLEDLVGGSDPEPIESMTAGGNRMGTSSSSCLDPWGMPCDTPW